MTAFSYLFIYLFVLTYILYWLNKRKSNLIYDVLITGSTPLRDSCRVVSFSFTSWEIWITICCTLTVKIISIARSLLYNLYTCSLTHVKSRFIESYSNVNLHTLYIFHNLLPSDEIARDTTLMTHALRSISLIRLKVFAMLS